LPDLPRQTLQFFPAQEVADVLGVSKKTIHRRADALRWPRERVGCGFHYCVSADVAARIAAARAGEMQNEECKMQNEGGAELAVKFEDIANDERQARKVGLRQAAVEMCASFRDLGREAALALTVQRMREEHPALNICVRSLRDWCQAYAAYGVNGLVEQKRGIVGRHGVEVPTEFANLGKALVIERGSRAMAARELATHPDLPAGMRLFLHSGHATKSYVTPSIARAISPAVLTKDLIQGPKNARLKGRWTPGDYSQCRAGDFFVSDDMTSNVLCWCEWPNAQGWRIGQAQILPVMDVRALRWLNVRVIMRDGGQYNAQDDIWGLFGDVFDTFGLPAEGFVLEGGSWQSNVIRGVRTGLDADIRIGGLESLGLRNVRSYDPRSKIIETQFNTFQRFMDRMPGWAGRDQRTQLGEAIKKRIALLRVKNPEHHPREFFPHVSQLADQVKLAMENQNHERQDGKLLRGLSPLELWSEHNPQLRSIPDSAKWLYRSAMNVSKVTSNGVRVTRGSGAKQVHYFYDNPALLVPRQGQNVITYWNDSNPEADACLRDARTRAFIGMAKYVRPLDRFNATDEELTAEDRRKKAALHYARTEMRAIQPELVRETVPMPVDAAVLDIGARLAGETRGPAADMPGADVPRGNVPGADVAAEVKPVNRVDLFAEPAPEIETAATVAPSPAGAVGPVAPAQARGVREAVRAVVAGFGGRQFNLHEVRAKLPEPLREKATAVLCHLAQIGELVKTRRARWMQAPASGVAATNAGPQPGTVLENADGTKSYVLEPDTESGDAGGADARPGTGKYWALWKKVEARKTGMSRFALTRRTIGRVCKPQEMTAGELGKMIEVFLAILRESKGVEAVGATAGMGAV
jgi:hypothetical protein